MAALEETVLASVHKKGAKEFTLPGLLKVVAQDVPAKKKRFGKDPFTGDEKWKRNASPNGMAGLSLTHPAELYNKDNYSFYTKIIYSRQFARARAVA